MRVLLFCMSVLVLLEKGGSQNSNHNDNDQFSPHLPSKKVYRPRSRHRTYITRVVKPGTSNYPDPNPRGSLYYGRSRVSSTERKTSGRRKSSMASRNKESPRADPMVDTTKDVYSDDRNKGGPLIDESYFNQRYGKDEFGRDLFHWNGKEYVTIPRKVSSKKRTKTTVTKTKTMGNHHPLPETKTVTTFRNTTVYTSAAVPPDSTDSGQRYDSYLNQSSFYRTSASEARRKYKFTEHKISSGRDSSILSGFGLAYHKNTEEMLKELEDSYDENFAKGPYISEEDESHPFVLRNFGITPGYGQQSSCDRRSCYPATGNLLIGREDRLSATSTCGLLGKTKYCIVSNLKDDSSCFWCDSSPQFDRSPIYSHKIHNIVYRFDPRTGRRSWWQSENGIEGVSIRLDLEAEFHFTHLIITFRTFRPSAMLIERSFDFGKTWKVYRYFAYDCGYSFPGIPQGPPRTISDIVCESRYSAVEPSTEGEVIFRVLSPNIEIKDPYDEEVQNLLKITNLRVNFTKLHTLGDQLLDNRPEIKEKYYYAVYDMVVRGSCSCYGHASQCLPLPGVVHKENMVHGQCDCTHNTKGLNCEQCQDFYNDLPWRPAIANESNACRSCNCNNHATRCHFDPNIFEQSGRISGGVCDECEHNTQGIHCEECLPYFYHDPENDVKDPDACQSCHCDPRGSLDDNICDSRTDVTAGLLAGRCHCKKYVDGLKCDRCKAGFWNFSLSNSDGCQEMIEDVYSQPKSEWPRKQCTCHTLGTINNAGCNMITGMCQCKIFVTGRDCNQCLPQHYGLSEHPDGCLPCNCDRGGAFDNDCDVITGQCKCRPHVTGRQCDQPEEGYYVPTLNYFTYEAELARGSELYCEEASLSDYKKSQGRDCQVVMREPYRDGRETTWTGLGFMRVFDGSFLEFEVENIETSMEYDLVIRYEPQFRGSWENVAVTVERPGPVDPNGPCSHVGAFHDHMVIHFPESARQATLYPPVCLEKDKRYKIRVEFRRTNPEQDSPTASILVDSATLIPRAETLPIYSDSQEFYNLKQEYEHYRCSELFYSGSNLSTVPEVCLNDHLDTCQCDATGSQSSICDRYGGQCKCKLNVVGRRCDRCAPGTYEFGPEGCKLCDCSPVGSLDNFCDLLSGQCKCRSNTYGRQCNECQPGFWNYPDCKHCNCNGHADTCDPFTGYCHDCRDKTTGPNCAICIPGYYGDPRLDVGIACRPCPCPGTADSAHSFASNCYLDPLTKDVVCECQLGYAGLRCDICADNYYGNPEIPGGKCQECNCHDNIDFTKPGNCNPRTGECLKCLFNTDGFNCEVCKDGYYGDALHQECRECVCNLLGTNQTIAICDKETGQCPCLANVRGLECDRCEKYHWKIASGTGCEHCACDSVGSYSDQCNEYDGQCDCRPGFGGRQCDQCEANYYGDPRIECLACECNYEGSETFQCDRVTGYCKCRPGIGGIKCDKCARGFTGIAPYCNACGECFDNWDIILGELKERTQALLDSAGQIKQSGATGAYSHEFDTMDDLLNDVRNILLSANITAQSLDTLQNLINDLKKTLEAKAQELQTLESGVDDTTQKMLLANNTLNDLRAQATDLMRQADDLKNKATKLQEGNVEGALNLTRSAGGRSEHAQEKAMLTRITVGESERNRRRTENLLLHGRDRFNRTQEENENNLIKLTMMLDAVDESIPLINEQVCDVRESFRSRQDHCDKFCGGAGCNKCGGLSCDNGLVNKANFAIDFADDAESILKMKEAEVDELLRGMSSINRQSGQTTNLIEMAFNSTFEAWNLTSGHMGNIKDLVKEIKAFLGTPAAQPDEIRTIAEETLELDIKLKPAQITELAGKIAQQVESLTNIEVIINATRNNLELAVALKERADDVRKKAEDTLEMAKKVVQALEEANNAQDAAENAIKKATDDIATTELYMMQIASETSAAQTKANQSNSEVQDLQQQVEKVQSMYKINHHHLMDTQNAVGQAGLQSQKAKNHAADLENRYNIVVSTLDSKSQDAENARSRAEELKKMANKLSSLASEKLKRLKETERVFVENEVKFTDYEREIVKMESRMLEYHSFILEKAEFYATCQTGRR